MRITALLLCFKDECEHNYYYPYHQSSINPL